MPNFDWFSLNIYKFGVGGVPKPGFVPPRLKPIIASNDSSEGSGRLGAEVRISIESLSTTFKQISGRIAGVGV